MSLVIVIKTKIRSFSNRTGLCFLFLRPLILIASQCSQGSASRASQVRVIHPMNGRREREKKVMIESVARRAAHAFPCLIWLSRYRQRSWRHDSFLCHVWIITAGRLELALFRCAHHPPALPTVVVRFYRSALIHDFYVDFSRPNHLRATPDWIMKPSRFILMQTMATDGVATRWLPAAKELPATNNKE